MLLEESLEDEVMDEAVEDVLLALLADEDIPEVCSEVWALETADPPVD